MKLPKNIFVVEDEVFTQRYLQEILSKYDIDISNNYFDNAQDTLDALEHQECDMILMDINIRGNMDGIQLAKKILKTYNIPIIFITGYNDENTFDEILDLTPYGFISKPFSSKDILYTIRLAYKRFMLLKQNTKDRRRNLPDGISEEKRDYLFLTKEYAYSRSRQTLYKDNKPVKLNWKQNKLLEILVMNINHTIRYADLINFIWDEEPAADSSLRTLVYTIRKAHPDLPIVSYSKVGYSLEIDISM